MTTEQEARDIQTAITAFQTKDAQAQQQQRNQDIATAQQWFNTTIRLTWRATQAPRLQFTNSLADRTTLEAIRESRIKMFIIRKEIELITERIRTIKVSL